MILAINTSTLQFSLALLDEDGTLLTEYLMFAKKGHFGSLMPALHFLLTSSMSRIIDLKCISVAKGPGSFTGLRVGLSLAKGLSHAHEIPIVGISSLETMASQLPHTDIPIVPIISSRKGEVFSALFTWGNDNQLKRMGKDSSIKLSDFGALYQEPVIFVGNDYANQSPLLLRTLGPRSRLAPAHYWNLKASSLGAIGLRRFHDHDFDDPHALNPVYLRPPDIRPNPGSPL